MSKRKNYTTLFLASCRKHCVWFSVCVDSCIDQVTYLKDGYMIDTETSCGLKLGSKAAYDWIKREIREIEDDLKE